MTVFEFPDISSFVGSDVDVKLKTQFIQQKKQRTKAGDTCVFWCKFGKKRGYKCSVKGKIVKNDRKVLYMEEMVEQFHDHRENKKERCYENYTREQLNVMNETIPSPQ